MRAASLIPVSVHRAHQKSSMQVSKAVRSRKHFATSNRLKRPTAEAAAAEGVGRRADSRHVVKAVKEGLHSKSTVLALQGCRMREKGGREANWCIIEGALKQTGAWKGRAGAKGAGCCMSVGDRGPPAETDAHFDGAFSIFELGGRAALALVFVALLEAQLQSEGKVDERSTFEEGRRLTARPLREKEEGEFRRPGRHTAPERHCSTARRRTLCEKAAFEHRRRSAAAWRIAMPAALLSDVTMPL